MQDVKADERVWLKDGGAFERRWFGGLVEDAIKVVEQEKRTP